MKNEHSREKSRWFPLPNHDTNHHFLLSFFIIQLFVPWCCCCSCWCCNYLLNYYNPYYNNKVIIIIVAKYWIPLKTLPSLICADHLKECEIICMILPLYSKVRSPPNCLCSGTQFFWICVWLISTFMRLYCFYGCCWLLVLLFSVLCCAFLVWCNNKKEFIWMLIEFYPV